MGRPPRTASRWAQLLPLFGIVVGLHAAGCAFGDEELANIPNDGIPERPDYEEYVAPIIAQHCFYCHNEEASGLLFTDDVASWPFNDPTLIQGVFQCPIRRQVLSDRLMPPGAMDRLTAQELLIIDRWSFVPCEDPDEDGVTIDNDNCRAAANPDQANRDGDSRGDACDNCPDLNSRNQSDQDTDGIGDECDADRDGDNVDNEVDNCPDTANTDQADQDGDGVGDACQG